MKARRKERIARWVLLAFAIWPLVHHVLVVRYEISPWRLFGWSMYCHPRTPVGVQLYAVRPVSAEQPEGRRPIRMKEVPQRLGQQIDRFTKRRAVYGRLLRPDEMAQAVFVRWRRIEGLDIVVSRFHLEPSTGMYERHSRTYSYWR